ncbi:ABC transporter substrate-binding protein [Salinicola tamaricis]|uniref:ABC transporter substrate-binding protein n=1 Tax=Salinicola tamaricis TaxID=1771309 RepID=UPI0013EB8CE4|nr:ABC transporter substrate-binding protein [Salinicola tamaricis]
MALPAQAEIRVVDDHGEALTLAAPAKRIVALAPHLVEDAFAAGAGAQLVGVIAGSDYPAAARELPRVGSYRGIALEAVVSAQPDLVLAWGVAPRMTWCASSRRWGFRSTAVSRGDLPTLPATCAILAC